MRILPAIDIRQGRVVQLVGGDPAQVAVTEERKPAQQALHWKDQGASAVHVVDLDGAFGQRRQWHHLAGICATGLGVTFGGGVRSMLDVQRIIDMGARHIVVGTQGVREPAWLRELAGVFPGRIILAIDARGRDVQIKGWTESAGRDVVELAAEVADLGLAGLLYTNVDKEGKMEGIDADVVRAIRDVAPSVRLIVSGGIATMEDLAVLDGLGVDAVVLGMSIYTGALDVAQAVARFERELPEEA